MTEKDLEVLVQKLKANREKVPAELLRTKYAVPYGKLKRQISEALKEEAVRIPDSLQPVAPLPPWLLEAIARLATGAMEEAATLPKLRRAIYRHYDAAEAMAIAREANKAFLAALAGYVEKCACLVLDLREPDRPKIYNYYLGMYWNEDAGTWRRPGEGEAVPDAGRLWEEKRK